MTDKWQEKYKWQKEHPDRVRISSRKYHQSEKGKAAAKRSKEKLMADPERHKKRVEYQRKYNREHSLVVNGKHRRINKRPRPDNKCELCNKVVERLHYHHWDDSRPELGMWVCGRCHSIVEEYEKGLITAYNNLKGRIEQN